MDMAQVMQSWMLGLAMRILRATCRVRIHDDPREELRAKGEPYVYSILHAHLVSAAIKREPGTAAMVSQSGDGQLLLAGFRMLGIKAVRGSNRRTGQDKGGQAALEQLISHVASGSPAILAVDGPRGPRNRVRKGIATLSRRSNAAVLNVVAVPTRRWVLRRSWDGLQIPKPFCRIDAYFAEPLRPDRNESLDQFRGRIERSLNQLEAEHDPTEALRSSRHHDHSPEAAATQSQAA